MINLINDDCLNALKHLDADSVDSLVTDPPAGISFMGKEWDSDKGGRDGWIAWMTEVMRECHRVLKPGAHGLVWAIPRTSHWTATALENAGFEVRDVMTHLFGSGFPKSLDISKAIDKSAGAEREVIGSKDVGPDHRGSNYSNKALGKRMIANITIPTTDAAKQWQGWGTALKPASEHWILVRKPLSEKTVASNVLMHGTGGINIDASRIASDVMPKSCTNQNIKSGAYSSDNSERDRDSVYIPSSQGRFPANLVLSHSPHCQDYQCDIECAILQLDAQSGISKSSDKQRNNKASVNQAMSGANLGHTSYGHNDSGGASRFFYCAKISTSERNAGLDDMPDRQTQSDWPQGGISEGNENRGATVKNHHPTVKPKKLMSYFCKMITPPEGIVLDPFMGSGSTGIAAKECGFKFIGIEREPDYFEIASKRIKNTD